MADLSDFSDLTDPLTLGETAQQAAREGRDEEAVALWDRAVAINPRGNHNIIALTNYLVGRGDVHGAIARCVGVLEAQADLYEVWFHLGILQNNYLSDRDSAINSIEKSIKICPEYKLGHSALAELYYMSHNIKKMRYHAYKTISGLTTNIEIYLLMRCLCEYEICIVEALRMLEINPRDVALLAVLATSYRLTGKYASAYEVLNRVVEIAPNNIDCQLMLAEVMILTGDVIAGQIQLEKSSIDVSMRLNDPRAEALDGRRWRGQSLEGKRIILVARAGFGDSLMFARWGRSLQALGAQVTFACRPEMVRLMSQQVGFDAVTQDTSSEMWAAFDYWVIDHFVHHYARAPENVNLDADAPYICAPAAATGYWRDRLRSSRRSLKVGLCWASGPHYLYGLERSIQPELLRSLVDIDGVEWFAAQKFSDHEAVNEMFDGRLIDYSGEWSDFADSAAMVAQLDLVISIDSAPLHLAGAMGVPVWGLIPFAPEWRWGLAGEESSWYPTLRLFRQTRWRDWTDTISRVRAELTAFVGNRGQRNWGDGDESPTAIRQL